MPQYMLACHVFVCMQGEHVVFLDVRKDRYFALESASTAGLGYLVQGWPIPAPVIVAPLGTDSTAAAIAENIDHVLLRSVVSLLLEKGILTTDAASGKAAEATIADHAQSDLVPDGLDEERRIVPMLFLRFVWAAVRARLLLKYYTFESVVARVRLRTERARATDASAAEGDIAQIVSAFARLRPFFFSTKDACLFDALCLSELLVPYGVFPRWIFGVQSRPFAAHCWLQLGNVVLNDTVDHVKRYTPIMVV